MSNEGHKPLNFLHDAIKSPPMSLQAMAKTGYLLRKIQASESIGMPNSRPMPTIGKNVHELRVIADNVSWRVIYRIGPKTIDIVDVFSKKTQATPKEVIDQCRKRLANHDAK